MKEVESKKKKKKVLEDVITQLKVEQNIIN